MALPVVSSLASSKIGPGIFVEDRAFGLVEYVEKLAQERVPGTQGRIGGSARGRWGAGAGSGLLFC